MGNTFVLDHPMASTHLKLLRDKNSSADLFRKQALRLSRILAVELTRDLHTEPQECETPMCKTTEQVVSESIALAPILRAGVGMVEPLLDFLPQAHVFYLGMYRDEETHQPVSYYNKLNESKPTDVAYVLDPMLATGGSAIMAIEALKEWGVPKIKFAGLIGAPEGVEALHAKFPDVDVYLATLDEKLNENAYIVPGLGDAGDRMFNT